MPGVVPAQGTVQLVPLPADAHRARRQPARSAAARFAGRCRARARHAACPSATRSARACCMLIGGRSRPSPDAPDWGRSDACAWRRASLATTATGEGGSRCTRTRGCWCARTPTMPRCCAPRRTPASGWSWYRKISSRCVLGRARRGPATSSHDRSSTSSITWHSRIASSPSRARSNGCFDSGTSMRPISPSSPIRYNASAG